jgi:hypothetical protein
LERNFKDLCEEGTTAEVCEKAIKSITALHSCSLAEYWSAINSSVIGIPDVFISHAWKYKFRDFVDALVSYFGKDTYVWLDFVCCNQHKAASYPFEWWTGSFKSAISSIGKTVMVLAPWNNPIPLTRGWCIWELYSTIDSEGCEFDITMTPESERAFMNDIDTNPTVEISKMLGTIDCANSECFKEEDKTGIHSAVKKNHWISGNEQKNIRSITGLGNSKIQERNG